MPADGERYLIRNAVAADREIYARIWDAYCRFSEFAPSPRVTQTLWQRIVAPDAAVHALLAIERATGDAVGFANYVVHPTTWSERPACYLEDLFVRRGARRNGAGSALVEHAIALLHTERWERLYWVTEKSNRRARRFYEKFCERDDFIRYVIENEAPRVRRASAANRP